MHENLFKFKRKMLDSGKFFYALISRSCMFSSGVTEKILLKFNYEYHYQVLKGSSTYFIFQFIYTIIH